VSAGWRGGLFENPLGRGRFCCPSTSRGQRLLPITGRPAVFNYRPRGKQFTSGRILHRHLFEAPRESPFQRALYGRAGLHGTTYSFRRLCCGAASKYRGDLPSNALSASVAQARPASAGAGLGFITKERSASTPEGLGILSHTRVRVSLRKQGGEWAPWDIGGRSASAERLAFPPTSPPGQTANPTGLICEGEKAEGRIFVMSVFRRKRVF